jgi:hypothetical protein
MGVEEALTRIRREFSEMPDLKLTVGQLRRLCNLSEEACDTAVITLVTTGFLRKSVEGQLLRARDSPSPREI